MRYLMTALLTLALSTSGCSEHDSKPAAAGKGNGANENDDLAPTVSISPPSQVYHAPRTIVISATTSDNVGVRKVRFYDNGRYRGTDYSAPFTHHWSFTDTDNGTHRWQARAYDASGNSNAASVTLDVDIGPPPDTEAPSISINPATGQRYTSAQTVTISASASDNVALASVEFYYDGSLVEYDSTEPYAIGWSVTADDNGSHTWQAIAYDAAGNSASDQVMLDVDIELVADTEVPDTEVPDTGAPGIAISPATYQKYTSDQTVLISAAPGDNMAIARVEFYYDGILVGIDKTSPYTINWSITANNNGSHTWQAFAYDAAGNSYTSSVTLDVEIGVPWDSEAPSVKIRPATSKTYTSAQTVAISATTNDNVAIARVEFYHNGHLVRTDTRSPYVIHWPVSTNDNGSHAWQIIAYDTAGNSVTDRVDLFVDIAPGSGL